MERAIEGFFVLATFFAAWNDVRTRRIPNALTLGLIALGVAGHLLTAGWLSALESLALAASFIVVGSFAYSRRWLAGGDIKLLAAGIAVFGYPDMLGFLLFTGLFGGVLAIAVAMRQHRLFRMLTQMTYSVVVPGIPFQPAHKYASVPYGVAIAGGAVLIFLSRCFTGLPLPL
jgi:prepilin peptidase CpaA